MSTTSGPRRAGVAASVVAALALLGTTRAAAQGGSASAAAAPEQTLRREAMLDELTSYLRAEERAGAVFGGTGLAALVVGAVLTTQGETGRGAAYPLLAAGVGEIAIGAVLWTRTSAQLAALQTLLERDPAEFRRRELARMRRVVFWFRVLEAVEGTVAASGIAMAAAGGARRIDTLTGVGVGLALQGGALLVLDLFADRRARRYLSVLERFDVSGGRGVNDDYWLGVRFRQAF